MIPLSALSAYKVRQRTVDRPQPAIGSTDDGVLTG